MQNHSLAGLAGVPTHLLAGGNVVHDAAAGRDHRAGPDRDVVGNADPSAHHHVVSDRAAARNAGMRGKHAMPADLDVVRDLDEVVDLGPLPDHGVADGAAVDGGIGADLDVVLDDDAADLRNLAVAAGARQIAEAILPDAHAGMDDDAVADQRMHDRRARADHAIAADAHIRADHGGRPDHRAGADFRARADHRRRDRSSRRISSRAVGCTSALGDTPLASNSEDGRIAPG